MQRPRKFYVQTQTGLQSRHGDLAMNDVKREGILCGDSYRGESRSDAPGMSEEALSEYETALDVLSQIPNMAGAAGELKPLTDEIRRQRGVMAEKDGEITRLNRLIDRLKCRWLGDEDGTVLARKEKECDDLRAKLLDCHRAHPFRRVQQMTLEEIEVEIGQATQPNSSDFAWYYHLDDASKYGIGFRFTRLEPEGRQLQAARLCLLCKLFLEAQGDGE